MNEEQNLREKEKEIAAVYKNSLKKINEVGTRAVAFLRDLKKKKQQKKAEELSKELKG